MCISQKLKYLVLITIVTAIQSCADPVSGVERTYDEFITFAFDTAGQNSVDCGSGDSSDVSIISCLHSSFQNQLPAVGIFWGGQLNVTALAFRNSNSVNEINYSNKAPERGGDGGRVRTKHVLCIDPVPNINSTLVHSVFECSDRTNID